MQVKDLMTTNVVTVRPNATLEMVAEVLHKNHFTGVPVVQDDSTLLGTIMERDFITPDSQLYLPTYIHMLKNVDFYSADKKHLPAEVRKVMNATAQDVVTKSIVYVYPETSLEELAHVFATKRVNPVPVVDSHFKIVGIISRSDLIKLYSKENLHPPLAVRETRIIDAAADSSYRALDKKFIFVNRSRASVWMLISISMLFIGFFLGIAWMLRR